MNRQRFRRTVPRTVVLALVIGALALPGTASAVRPVKPPKNPTCVLSAGVSMTSMKVKGVTNWLITGTSGDDTIDCSASTAPVGVTILSVDGQDLIKGTPFDDDIFEQSRTAGNHAAIFGMGGADYIEAGWGDENAFAQVNVEGGAGDDMIIATGGSLYVLGNDGNDTIDLRQSWNSNGHGGEGNDLIRGPESGVCNLSIGCGNPLAGDAGNDIIFGGAGRDDIEGGAGVDELHGADGDDLLIDTGSGAETFDCGNGFNDTLHDLDGNGVGANGTGHLNQPEDDDHVDCEATFVAVPACSYTPGTTGCIVLSNVVMTDTPTTATYTVSGTVSFTPTCQNLAPGCDYSTIQVSGGGTFSVSGSQTASGTWTIPPPPNDRNGGSYFFSDGSSPATCAAAAIRAVTFNFPLLASNGDTGGGNLTVRTDDVGTSDVVGGQLFIGPLPTGLFRNPVDSQAGVTILC